MNGNRLLVCGSRDWGQKWANDMRDERPTWEAERGLLRVTMFEVVTDLYRKFGNVVVIDGCATGADQLAYIEALRLQTEHLRFPADWSKGRGAGPVRNQKMLVDGNPGLALAFVTKPLQESRGTYDMVTRLRKAGVPVVVHGPT